MEKTLNNYPVQSYSMEYKIGMALLNWIGIPTTILGVVVNWGDVRGTTIFILSLIFLCIRAAFYVDERISARKTRRIENEIKELDLKRKARNFKKESEGDGDVEQQHY